MPIEVVCAIVFGVIATVLAVVAIVQSYVQWRAQARFVEPYSLPDLVADSHMADQITLLLNPAAGLRAASLNI
jgi:hypothetical protein